jgi:cbb3-type cytochrome oxidase subunit 3
MIKLALSGAGLAPFAVIGLIVFVGVFVGVGVWAITRRKAEIKQWAAMPLGDIPVESSESKTSPEAEKKSCVKCENCKCNSVIEIQTL